MKAATIKSYYKQAVKAGQEARAAIEKAHKEYQDAERSVQQQVNNNMITEKARRELLAEAAAKRAREIEEAQQPLDKLKDDFRAAVREEMAIKPDAIASGLLQYLKSDVEVSAEEMQELSDRYMNNLTMQRYLKAYWEPRARKIQEQNERRGERTPYEVTFAADQSGNVGAFNGFCESMKSISRSGMIPPEYTRGTVKIKDLQSYRNQRAQESFDYIILEKGDSAGDMEEDFPVETEGAYQTLL